MRQLLAAPAQASPFPRASGGSTTGPSAGGGVRPVVILPGLGNNSADYKGLVGELKSRGVPSVVVAEVSRADWLRNAAGLLDPNYWRGTLSPRPILDWYLRRVHSAVDQARRLSPGGELSLIGHSAGGWLARLYMQEFGSSGVPLLLTLGTPHLPPPKDLPGIIDQTRGLLDYIERECAPAAYEPELKYVCVAGRYIKGVPLFGGRGEEEIEEEEKAAALESDSSSAAPGGLSARIVGQGYKQVCGRADVWGDGVVPEISAHLEGALNLTLPGVYHSPVGSDAARRPWYGSPAALDLWFPHIL